MFCNHCGKEVNDEAIVCPHCGCSPKGKAQSMESDTGSIGWGILGFLFPIIGLILYLVWKDTKPLSAKVAGKGALISVIISIIFSIIYGIIACAVVSAAVSSASYYY